jgi:hypothetical protein
MALRPRARRSARLPGAERRLLERAYKAAKVAWIKPNEFGRHFFATHAVNDLEADIYPVKEWLGHTGPKTTERYAHMRPIPIARIFNPKAKGASSEKTATQVAVFLMRWWRRRESNPRPSDVSPRKQRSLIRKRLSRGCPAALAAGRRMAHREGFEPPTLRFEA